MKLTIEIDCDNDAFADGKLTNEVRSIISFALMDLTHDIEEHLFGNDLTEEIALFDTNGNHVGLLTYK